MKVITIGLLGISLIGCGVENRMQDWQTGLTSNTTKHHYDGYSVDEEFIEYIVDFPLPITLVYIDVLPASIQMPIVFDNNLKSKGVSEKAIGVCFEWNDGWKEIGIDIDYWNKSSYLRRKVLLWHELGHCILELNHDNSQLSTYNNSIMSTYTISSLEIQNMCNYNINNLDNITTAFCESI